MARTAETFRPQKTYAEITSPADLIGVGISTLAWLTHEAEAEEDDIVFAWTVDEAHRRGTDAFRLHADEYKRLWPQHAASRGYA